MITNLLRRWKRRRLLEKVYAGTITINEARRQLGLPPFPCCPEDDA